MSPELRQRLTPRPRSGVCFVAAGLLSLAFLPCWDNSIADVIVMQSGLRFQGEVTDSGDNYILVTPSGSKMTLAKRLVREVLPDETPASSRVQGGSDASPTSSTTASPTASPTRGPAQAPPPSNVTLYVVIPLEGVFGKDICAEGVSECLRYCTEVARAKHVVFRIKSLGGTVDAAQDIQDALMKYSDRLVYHAYVEQAMSAAIFVVFACNTVHMADGSSVGAAVPFVEAPTGSKEVDAKFASAMAAKIAALASSKGHSPIIAKAMVIQQCEAYAWTSTGSGKVNISDSMPDGAQDLIIKDTPTTILTLTRADAVAVGFAKPIAGGIENLGQDLGLAGWRKVSEYAENVMLRTKLNLARKEEAIRQLEQKISALIRVIKSNTAEAEANDPVHFSYLYDASSGALTSESAAKKVRQATIAIQAWQRVQSTVAEIMQMGKEMAKFGSEKTVSEIDLNEVSNQAQREIARLSAVRSSRGLP